MKTQKQENFPVACLLFPRRYRKIISHYYDFARYCDDIADSTSLNSAQKLDSLDLAEQALFGKGDLPVSTALRTDFLSEGFDFSLATDLLIAFRQDAQNKTYQTWNQLLEYSRYSAAPVGRFMLALFNENPSTYLPASALCIVLQITNHLQDLKSDFIDLNRLYFPEELLLHYNITKESFLSDNSSKNLQFLKNDVLDRCRFLLKDARILPAILRNRRLKTYICITLSLTDILIKKLYHGDVLATKIKLTLRDRLLAVIQGIFYALTTTRKTLTNKGL